MMNYFSVILGVNILSLSFSAGSESRRPRQSVDGKILHVDHSQLQFKCQQSNSDPSVELCLCESNAKKTTLSFGGYNRKMVREAYVPGVTRRILFLDCSLHIRSDFFHNMNLTLEALEIQGAQFLELDESSLNFQHQTIGLHVILRAIGEPMRLRANIFKGNVELVQFEHCKLEEFSSQVLQGLPAHAQVEMTSTQIHSHFYSQRDTKSAQDLVTLHSLNLKDVFVSSSGAQMLNLKLSEFSVVNSELVVDEEGAIRILEADFIQFRDSVVDMRRGAFHMEVDKLWIERVTFQYPTETFKFARGLDHNSTLTLKDIFLYEPSLGALTNTFKNVHVENITSNECDCSLLKTIVQDRNQFMGRIFQEDVDTSILEEMLRNETYCLDSGYDQAQPLLTYCQVHNAPRYGLTIGLIIAAFLICLLVITSLMYQWHKQIINRYRLLRYTYFVPRGAAHVTTVRFNDSLQIIPRPPSVFYIDANYSGSSIFGSQPDLVRTVRDSLRNSFLSNRGSKRQSVGGSGTSTEESDLMRKQAMEELEKLEKTNLEMIKELDEDGMVEIDLIREVALDECGESNCGSVIIRDSVEQ